LEGKNTLLGGHDFCFYHIFKTNVLGTRKFGEAQKKFGGALPPNASPRGYGLAYQVVDASFQSPLVGPCLRRAVRFVAGEALFQSKFCECMN